MFVQHIGYRHDNGTIEAFAGRGLTLDAARQHGVALARRAVTERRTGVFTASRLIADLGTLDRGVRRNATAGIETRAYLAAFA